MPPLRQYLIFYLALGFALAYAFVIPPFQSPDEPNHFYKGWSLSRGDFWAKHKGNRVGGTLPLNLPEVVTPFSVMKGSPKVKVSMDSLRKALNVRENARETSFFDFANTAIYAPFAYFPQAGAVLLCRSFHLPPLAALYAARLSNIVFFFLLLGQILRYAPHLREIFYVLTLLPATLVLVASASPDVSSLAWAWLLLVSLFVRPEVFSRTHKVVLTFLLCLQKMIAFPLTLINWRKNNLKESLIISAIALSASLTWGYVAQQQFIPYDRYDPEYRDSQTLNSGVDPSKQWAFIREHPLEVSGILLRSFVKSLPSTAAHVAGKFGWEKNYLPGPMMALLWLALIAVCAIQPDKWLTSRQRMLLLLAAAGYTSAFAVSNYMLWSAVGSQTFDNWQGRYFLPVLPLVCLAFSNDLLARWRPGLLQFILAILLAGNLNMILALLYRYWL